MNIPEQIHFTGPFTLNPSIPNTASLFDKKSSELPGIYLWTMFVNDEDIPYYVGITHKSIAARTRNHIQNYISGVYDVYDVNEMKNLKRVIKHSRKERPESFLGDANAKLTLILDMLNNTRIYFWNIETTDVETSKTVLKRIESGLIRACRLNNGDFIENKQLSINIIEDQRHQISVKSDSQLLNIKSIYA